MPTKKQRITEQQIMGLIKPPVVGHVDEKYDVYIGDRDPSRGLTTSMWANPYGNRYFGLEGGLERYEEWVRSRPELMEMIELLQGKTLGCTCYSKGQPTAKICHGEILRKIYIEQETKRIMDAPEF